MRLCNECQACCQGWLIGEAYGVKFGPNKPCVFLQEKCTIYEIRPPVCKKYYCAWIQELFPDWMRPDKVKVLITVQDWSQGQFLKCVEMGQTMQDDVFIEIQKFCKEHNTPYMLQYDGHWKICGPDEFIKEITSERKQINT